MEVTEYPDPKSVRDNRMALRLNDAEWAVITSMAQYLGEQPATLARQLLLRQAAESTVMNAGGRVGGGECDCAGAPAPRSNFDHTPLFRPSEPSAPPTGPLDELLTRGA